VTEVEASETETFLDDRMFVLGVYPARLAKDKEENHQTVIFYDKTPDTGLWTVLTFRNVADYPLVGVAHFEREEHARAYKDGIEPSIPLTSLGGQSPQTRMTPDDFAAWKEEMGFKDFHPDNAPRLVGEDRGEIVMQTKEQFIMGLQQVASVLKGPGA
jgi:hypothetical protein